MSEVEAALQKALSTAQGKKEKRPAYLKRLQEGAQELDSEKWDELPTAAQLWVNDATKAANDDKELPDFEQDDETQDDAVDEAADESDEAPKEGKDVNTRTKKKAVAKKVPAKEAKKVPAKERGTGVIASLKVILSEGAFTVDQIVAKLAKKFPDRKVKSMAGTVRVQLSRLPRESNFKVVKGENSKGETTYKH